MENTKQEPLVERSVSIVEIAKSLSKFQSSLTNVVKEAENPFFKSSYATIANIIETIRKPLGDNGLSFAQFPIEDNRLVTLVMHSSGEYFQSVLKMFPKDTTPQAQGSAMTYMRRYALTSILGIATEDDDGNEGSKPKTAIVKTGKGTDDYANAVIYIEKATKVSSLEEMLAKLDQSTKFTDGEKTKLEGIISRQIDVITSKQA